VALAPVYLDSELGIHQVLGEYTDLGIGIAGGGFADSYVEFHQGKYIQAESFLGHVAEGTLSLYHLINPAQRIPLNLLVRGSVHHSFYEDDDNTSSAFELPSDMTSFNIRTGLRWGGSEPVLFPALAMELSTWYATSIRMNPGTYGFNNDRSVEPMSHLFWAHAMLNYTFPEWEHSFRVNLVTGTSINADRFSAYRLGAYLPLASEFPLNLPGYYYQELSAQGFLLMGGSYLMPLEKKKRWNLFAQASGAYVDYLPGLEQPGHWHSGVGGGVLFRSDAIKFLVTYGYGVNAMRSDGRGAHNVGFLLQFDLERANTVLNPMNLYRWSGWLRLLGS
jgi:hypothetical protein